MGNSESGQFPQSAIRQLKSLLERCTVQVHSEDSYGSGFFVLPGLALTCAHVVSVRRNRRQKVTIFWGGRAYDGRLKRLVPDPCPEEDIFPDLATIDVAVKNHPCALLGTGCESGIDVYGWGFGGMGAFGESFSAKVEGLKRYGRSPERTLIKLKEGQISEGFSGAPVLNCQTGVVCGLIKRTRDLELDQGGFAIRTEVVLARLKLARRQQAYHRENLEWPYLVSQVKTESGMEQKYFVFLRAFKSALELTAASDYLPAEEVNAIARKLGFDSHQTLRIIEELKRRDLIELQWGGNVTLTTKGKSAAVS